MRGSTPRLRTFRDIIDALPEHLSGQVIGGRLIVGPRPSPPHLLATHRLQSALGPSFDLGSTGPGGRWILAEPELSLDADPDFDPVNPDLAGWRRDTLSELPDTAAVELDLHTLWA